MRIRAAALGLALAGLASAQNVNNVYNRDTHDQFQLKGLKVYSTVMGPIVRTSAQFTYDNPAKKLTEASVWFDLPEAAALSGFGYYYKNEYVPGILMDQNKAWFIYTAITSRNEDPGILDQKSPTSFHAQIFPLAQGYDLRVHLYSVGFLAPRGDAVPLPQPCGTSDVPVDWQYRQAGTRSLVKIDPTFRLPKPDKPVVAVAQKFKDGRTYVAGVVQTVNPATDAATFAVLRNAQSKVVSSNAVAFAGWLPANKKIAIKTDGVRYAFKPDPIQKGPEAAQLWAQEMLANGNVHGRNNVLAFSMKYHIPSYATALLAVPKEEMKVYKAKAAEYRRQQLAEARRHRPWEKQRRQNWNNSGGGDPEIRVQFTGAEKVYAVLPDGQVIDLRESDGFWGGNFEIPASAKEGSYDVKIVAFKRDGSREEKTIQYHVSRTAPEGKITLKLVGGQLVIEVRSEPGLAEVAAYDATGGKTVLKEVEPGLYRAILDNKPVSLTVILKDKASNKRELRCSWQPPQ
ncbi:MAG: VIT domain-containing protein [Fimbriimonadales bacterium]